MGDSQIQDQLDPRENNLLVGTASGDDAAVWENPDGSLTIYSVDAFTPVVDDPKLYGYIAAVNAASDIFAMGGQPSFALNIVVWPEKKLGLDILKQVIEGGAEAAAKGSWAVVGGHTISGVEPIYGQAVIGYASSQDDLMTNAGGEPDQALILTKPIGTGIVATALKAHNLKAHNLKAHNLKAQDLKAQDLKAQDLKAQEPPSLEAESELNPTLDIAYKKALGEMCRLNSDAAEIAKSTKATAATDITGFGLLGHLHKMALASGVMAILETSKIPVIEGVLDLLEYSPGGTQKNLDFVENFLDFDTSLGDYASKSVTDGNKAKQNNAKHVNPNPELLKLWADPQTSGGLLFSCPEKNAETSLQKLHSTGHQASIIGKFVDPKKFDKRPGHITLL